MTTHLEDRLKVALARRSAIVNLRTPSKTKADLFSNDYLSLSRNSRLRSRLLNRLAVEPENVLGSTGSRLLDGNTKTHVDFEDRLRRYYNADAALLFNSGYDANLSLFGSLPRDGDMLVYDEIVHASILDGFRSSRAAKNSYSFKHNSVDSLQVVLGKILLVSPHIRSGSRTVYVAFETVYSMGGDIAPLRELVEAVERTLPTGCAQILIDESHSTGLYGPAGRGLVSHLGLEKHVAFRLYTFSKTLASSGAVLLTSPIVRTYLINFARPLIYTTSMSRVCILATELSLDIVEGSEGEELRERLFALTKFAMELFRQKFASISPDILRILTPKNTELQCAMIPILMPYAVPLCMRLRTQGWATVPIISPVVPAGEERIRFIVHAGNTKQEIDEFAQAILACVREGNLNMKVIPRGIVFDEPPQEKYVARL